MHFLKQMEKKSIMYTFFSFLFTSLLVDHNHSYRLHLVKYIYSIHAVFGFATTVTKNLPWEETLFHGGLFPSPNKVVFFPL